MIKSIKVTTKSGLTQTMELGRPDTSGFLIRSISGLTPGSADLKMTEYASLPGSVYSGSRKPTRNIVIDMVILWKNTVEDGRHAIERLFRLGETVRLDIKSDTRECYTSGVVETNEPTIFDNGGLPGIACQISIICPDPRLFDVNDTILVTYSALQNGFNFPASIVSGDPVGILESENKFNIIYDGTENEGVIFTFVFKRNVGSFKIKDYNKGTYMLIVPQDPFVAGDILVIDTRVGEKSIMCTRNGLTYNYLNFYKVYESTFIELETGRNSFIIETDGVSSGSYFTVRVAFTKAYWGV